MYMVLFVLDNPDFLARILEAWSRLGVSGATIIESSGLHRQISRLIPMRYTYGAGAIQERGNTTLLVIVDGEPLVQACLQAVETIVGDLDQPNTGVFTAWPVAFTKGIPPRRG